MALGAPIGVPDVIACDARLRALLRACPGNLNSEHCPENTPEISEKSRSHTHPPPPHSCDLFVIFRGKCCAFFSGVGFWEFPLFVLAFFSVLLVLGFLCEGFFGKNSRAGVGRGEVVVFCLENVIASLEKPRGKKFSLSYPCDFRVLLFLGVPIYRVLWGELRRYIGTFFGARFSCRGIVFMS